MRSNPRRIPAWHHQNSFQFYTPSTSARMEKRYGSECSDQWTWDQSSVNREEGSCPCLEACFCPCTVYSRCWARLKAALAGHDAEQIPNLGFFTSECFEYAACLPLSTCFLARLQGTVRSLYGIRGETIDDYADAYFCPWVTLQRTEYEIVTRERKHRKPHPYKSGTNASQTPSHPSHYEPHGPMTYTTSNIGTPSTSQNPRKSGEGTTHTVPSIRIDTAEASMPRQPNDGNVPIINITSPQVFIETSSPSHSVVCVADPQVASGLIIQPEHNLQDDTTVAVRGKFKDHLLNQDSASDTSSVHKVREHTLKDDVEQQQPKSSNEHAIVECTDGTTSPRPGVTPAKTTLSSVTEVTENTATTRTGIFNKTDNKQEPSAEPSSQSKPIAKPAEEGESI